MDDLRPWHPLRRLLTARPYLADGTITHTDTDIRVIYHYALGDERFLIEAAQERGDLPPFRWVRGWIDDWERHLREPDRQSTTDRRGRPTLTLTGLLEDEPVVVTARPEPYRGPRGPHPLVAQLTAIRTSAGITRTEAAHQAGYSPTTLHGWETGRSDPTLAQLTDYAQVLDHNLTLTPIDPTDPGEHTQ